MSTAELLAPYAHVASLKSKNLRDAFIDAVNDVVGAPAEHTTRVKGLIAKLHNASLLIDDIEDSATRRRGQPAAHLIFGTPLTMNAANMVIFDALAECIAIDRSTADVAGGAATKGERVGETAVEIFQHELAMLHHGQGQDIYWRDTNRCPTADEYRKMVVNKTGGLFRLAVRLVMVGGDTERLADAVTEKLLAFTNHVSYLFQVLDDLLNLSSSDYHEKKTYCEDLSEGKFSFLTTHSVLAAQATGDTRLLRLLHTRPQEVDVKRFCLQLMSETGTFAHTRDTLATLSAECSTMLDELAAAKMITTSPTTPLAERTLSRDGDDISRSPTGSTTVVPTARLRGFVDRLAAAVPATDPAF